ncbi:MAG: ubiquitin-like domain-containing protein [Desulfitobacteriaceae bacterium]|nr:ubiquitin-like domain-containing protein [Desulfitobacteriaceae bacterium]MDD4347106.1 ubiquitin-like domain-containing protein [Desulfitobacteriaceae bacterium]MDD4400292.1 ubiquitin-like domain-containing protein [Desulfitobacteriaceae bacterium]
MIRQIPVKAIYGIRTSRLAKIVLVVICLLLITTAIVLFKANTLLINIDGKTIRLLTLSSTVGEALTNSWWGIYPEDIVKPTRDTIVTPGLTIEVTRSNPIRLNMDDLQSFTARTTCKTVGEALTDLSQRFGLGIKDVDEVNYSRSDKLIANMELNVRRAILVHIQVDGNQSVTYLAPRTVDEALVKLGITLGEKDQVSLPLDHMLVPDDKIQVVRVVEKVETVKTEIPYKEVAQDADFPVGLPDRVINKGSNGLQEQTIKLTLEDGKEVQREVLNQRIVLEPVNKVVSRGAQTTISRGGSNYNFKQAIVMKATAYSMPGSRTATGVPARWGVVAVDPSVIPLGTKLYVDGYGPAVALDTGGAIRGKRIDLHMNTTSAAYSWGVRQVVVYIQ